MQYLEGIYGFQIRSLVLSYEPLYPWVPLQNTWWWLFQQPSSSHRFDQNEKDCSPWFALEDQDGTGQSWDLQEKTWMKRTK